MILIVGSNGHVGREIVKLAADQGLQTRCFDLAPADFSGLDTSSLESVVGDITDPAAVQQALKGVDTVMFVLGLKRQTKKLLMPSVNRRKRGFKKRPKRSVRPIKGRAMTRMPNFAPWAICADPVYA